MSIENSETDRALYVVRLPKFNWFSYGLFARVPIRVGNISTCRHVTPDIYAGNVVLDTSTDSRTLYCVDCSLLVRGSRSQEDVIDSCDACESSGNYGTSYFRYEVKIKNIWIIGKICNECNYRLSISSEK